MTDPTSPSAEILAILEARHGDPFSFLGRQPKEDGGAVVRTLQPKAHAVTVVARDGSGSWPMQRVHHHGFYTVDLPPEAALLPYDLELATFDGQALRSADPYSFGPLLGEQDLYFFCEGTHQRLWECLGARMRTVDGISGVQFAVWAPNAQRVSVIGDFNNWDGRINPMRLRIEGGVWEIFLPGIKELTHYKFEVLSAEGHMQVKSDPFAFYGQHGIQTASLVFNLDRYAWSDQEWMQKRTQTNLYNTPMSVYEVHLGSWKRVPEMATVPNPTANWRMTSFPM
jgi:1,4-alpha-glucan branching enzyme